MSNTADTKRMARTRARLAAGAARLDAYSAQGPFDRARFWAMARRWFGGTLRGPAAVLVGQAYRWAP